MKIKKTTFEGLFEIYPEKHIDSRGYFIESFSKVFFESQFDNLVFQKQNISMSRRNVLRGLHFQSPPYAQTKLVQCIVGEVLDVVVDLRKSSKTYGKHKTTSLNDINNIQLLIPSGFAHGFLVKSDYAIFSYKVDNEYNKGSEGGIIWNDSELGIDWGINKKSLILSEKDTYLPPFSKINNPFL